MSTVQNSLMSRVRHYYVVLSMDTYLFHQYFGNRVHIRSVSVVLGDIFIQYCWRFVGHPRRQGVSLRGRLPPPATLAHKEE